MNNIPEETLAAWREEARLFLENICKDDVMIPTEGYVLNFVKGYLAARSRAQVEIDRKDKHFNDYYKKTQKALSDLILNLTKRDQEIAKRDEIINRSIEILTKDIYDMEFLSSVAEYLKKAEALK